MNTFNFSKHERFNHSLKTSADALHNSEPSCDMLGNDVTPIDYVLVVLVLFFLLVVILVLIYLAVFIKLMKIKKWVIFLRMKPFTFIKNIYNWFILNYKNFKRLQVEKNSKRSVQWCNWSDWWSWLNSKFYKESTFNLKHIFLYFNIFEYAVPYYTFITIYIAID